MDEPTRRTVLKAGAAAAAMAAMPRVLAQQAGSGETAKFFEKGPVRIRYEDTGSGFPLMLLPGRRIERDDRVLQGQPAFQRDRGVQGRVSLHRGGPAQRHRPASPPAGRGRPAVGVLRRRPTRPDGSSGHRQVHGDGILHRRPLHLESPEARAQSCCRRPCWRSPWGGAPRCATRSYPGVFWKTWGPALIRPAARDHDVRRSMDS